MLHLNYKFCTKCYTYYLNITLNLLKRLYSMIVIIFVSNIYKRIKKQRLTVKVRIISRRLSFIVIKLVFSYDMAGFTENALIRKLQDLNSSQQSIQTLSLWLIHHRKHHAAVVKTWFKELLKGNLLLSQYFYFININSNPFVLEFKEYSVNSHKYGLYCAIIQSTSVVVYILRLKNKHRMFIIFYITRIHT